MLFSPKIEKMLKKRYISPLFSPDFCSGIDELFLLSKNKEKSVEKQHLFTDGSFYFSQGKKFLFLLLFSTYSPG
jgi:hypothetical protein